MASKIFMGNMPELMENILNNLDNDFYSLYSCSLVSRHWCNISIPILWRDPFSFSTKKRMFIYQYFSSPNEEEKLILNDCGVKIVDDQNTLFNYANFLKVIDLFCLDYCVGKWILLHSFNQQKDIITLKWSIINLLFKIFIENGATLSKLSLQTYDFIEIKSEVLYLLEEKKKFLSQLKYLTMVISECNINLDIKLLKILGKNATKINSLEINTPELPQLSNSFKNIINSQEQLRLFDFRGNKRYYTNFDGMISALESQKRTLKEIIIEHCAYSSEFEALKNCEKLEIVRILNCREEKLLKILNTINCKVSTLEINSRGDSFDASNIVQILEKSGLLLQRLKLNFTTIYSQSLLLEKLKDLCPNLIYFNISNFKYSTQFLKLLDSLKRLQFLTLCWVDDEPKEVNKMKRVVQLAEILPKTLQYLDLSDFWSDFYIDILLNHCDAPLKKLLFRINYKNYEEEIEALIRFCMRKRTLNSVNIDKHMIFINSDGHDTKIKKDLEGYVELVPYYNILVKC